MDNETQDMVGPEHDSSFEKALPSDPFSFGVGLVCGVAGAFLVHTFLPRRRIMHLDHITLNTMDNDAVHARTLQFYEEALQLPRDDQKEDFPSLRLNDHSVISLFVSDYEYLHDTHTYSTTLITH